MALKQHLAHTGDRCLGCVETENIILSHGHASWRNGHKIIAGEYFEEILEPAVGTVGIFQSCMVTEHIGRAPLGVFPVGRGCLYCESFFSGGCQVGSAVG